MAVDDLQAPVHPLARKCVDAIKIPADGTQSAIPPRALARLRQRLIAYRDERTLFEHLVVLWMRLSDDGLTVAANQLLDLARIGLAASALEETVQKHDPQATAARLIASRATYTQQPALAARHTCAGVNLRKHNPR